MIWSMTWDSNKTHICLFLKSCCNHDTIVMNPLHPISESCTEHSSATADMLGGEAVSTRNSDFTLGDVEMGDPEASFLGSRI